MIRYVRPAVLPVFVLACIVSLTACGSTGGATPPPPPPAVAVSVSPSSMTLNISGSQSITATVANATNTGVNWNATAGAIAGTGNTITYTAPGSQGTYSVTATSQADSSKSATTIVTVVTPPPPPPGVTVQISPLSMTLNTGASQSVTATVSNTSNTAVTWSTNGGSFTGTGNTVTYNAPSIAGNYTVTATSVADPTKSATATANVSAPPPPTLSISPLSATLAPGGTQQFTAATSAANPTFTWSATAGSFTGSGSTVTYTAPATAGSYTVSVSLNGANINPATASVTVTSQTILGMTIPASHPRLWWTPARIAQAKTWYAAHPFTPSDDLSIAWSHVVNGTDCSTAINDAVALQVPSAEALPTANGSDVARWSGETVILTYDWCFDQLTASQKATLTSNWNTWLNGISQQVWGGPGMPEDNYFWGNLRNELEWGIATYWENTGPATALLNDALVTRWLNAFVPPTASGGAFYGGIFQEGPTYGSSMATYPVAGFQTAQILGRNIYSESPNFEQAVYWTIYSTLPQPTFNPTQNASYWEMDPFGDDEIFVNGGVLAARSYFQDFMTFASNYWATAGNTGRYARQWLSTAGTAHSATYFQAAQDSGSATALSFSGLPLDFYGSGKGQFYARTAWNSTSTMATWTLRYPTGAAHYHEDMGNFHLWRNGRWLTRETTGYSNLISDFADNNASQDTNSVLAHNCVAFAPFPMQDGSTVRLGYPSTALLMPTAKNFANVQPFRVESQPTYAYSAADLTANYLFDTDHSYLNTGAAVHLERELLYIRSLETLVVFDRILTGNVTVPSPGPTAANVVNTFVIHFEQPPTIDDATHVTAQNGTEALRMTTLIPAAPPHPIRIVNEADHGTAGVAQYRLELDNYGAAQRYFLNVLQGRSASAANITATMVDSNPSDPTTGTFTVTLHPVSGSDVVIVFNKGQTSVGGSVTINGNTRSLLNRIQNVTIGDNGPVWETIP